MHCHNCGFANPAGFFFCGRCGTQLQGDPAEKKAKGEEAEQGEKRRTPPFSRLDSAKLRTPDSELPPAERRQLTVMFCDLVGSTALSEKLDPEELREVIRAYQQMCAEAIHRFDGYLARYIGDGILTYFGYPVAHEDDAQRAVHASLGILAALPQLNAQLQKTLVTSPLQVRIGIHTGLVVVGEMGGGIYRDPMAIVGETPNIAARLQELATPNTIMIGAATYRLIQGFFQCQELGTPPLKGISTPLVVYQVLAESGARSRLEVAASKGLTPLVNREEPIGVLFDRWQKSTAGAGQVVVLSGESGIGKSRLVQNLKERIVREPHIRLEFQCSPYYQNSALHPVIELLQHALQFAREDSFAEKLRKLEEALAQYSRPVQEEAPLLAALLSLPLPDHFPPLALTPQRQRQKTLDTLLAWLLTLTEKNSLLVIGEDLHWADPSTLELLDLFIEKIPTVRVLTLLTARPEFSPPWTHHPHITPITLHRLTRQAMTAMIGHVAKGKALPTEVEQQLVSKTDGIPLFIEELTRMVLESGLLQEGNSRYELAGPLPPLAIPTTLQDSLMARLDRLATVREVAQLGATLGREFSYELIHAVSPVDERTLQHDLTTLVDAQLLYQQGSLPQARYVFKHGLIQDAAYQSLLKSRRQQYHQRIALVLEGQFPDTKETQPELLAHHYTEAGLITQAIPFWQQAGQRALERSANVEAIRHLTKGLDLLKTIPETAERDQQELTLQIALGVALMAARGYAAPEAKHAYDRARDLCRRVGETPQLVPVLRGVTAFYFVRAELQTARELGEQLLHIVQHQQDPTLLIEAHQELGGTLASMGELIPALAHLEQGIALYDLQKHRSHVFLYGQDPGVSCLARASQVLASLGYPDQALKRSQEALTLAHTLGHPHSLAYALSFAALRSLDRGERQLAQQQAEQMVTLAAEQGLPFWEAMGTILRGQALAALGRPEEGVVHIRHGMAAYRATGAEIGWPYTLATLGLVYGRVGRVEEGLKLVSEALTIIEKTGERAGEAALYMFKGGLLLRRTKDRAPTLPMQEVEECFLRASDIARRQHARLLELRAEMSLSRLWQQQGRAKEARQRLSDIYEQFTEGFETADLQGARTLLSQLS